MPDLVWRVLFNNGTVPMYYWRELDARRAADAQGAKPPIQVNRPDGQPVN